ncbi:MAG: BrnT family toxin [Ghiorsea sp.]
MARWLLGLMFCAFVYTISLMYYQWDEKKCALNLAKHGVDFNIANGFDWDSAYVFEDTRFTYDERRMIAHGLIEDRLYALVFTMRDHAVRMISLRKANKREVTHYERKA